MELVTQKLFSILIDAVPGSSELISLQSIASFLELLYQKVDLQIEECIIATILLQRFIQKQELKNVYILNTSNAGMVLIVSFMLSLKLHRDSVNKNIYFAKLFEVSIFDLNMSIAGFLRLVDHDTWVQEEQYLIELEQYKIYDEVEVTLLI
ncbi:MAG: hypothetical protein EZS28_001776 [Streblomastix strix]|uniref:Cyclin N-terminal domain-containing protein n=1 Tax=Streblomastix strix TaxID=222440 RepID=A0A5J4X7W4_9EUKA|nr:MAG: hypothetical protein EZS28_001776 [Streblomastix strix]